MEQFLYADLLNYVLFFFSCSVMGWLMEVICKYKQFHRFINRGFLIGPYCPIYGFGAVCISILLTKYADSPIVVFLLAMVICGTLEYLTSYFMEKLFHARWWDYSHKAFNLNGRICANTLLPFGAMGILLVYWLKPSLFSLFDRIPSSIRLTLSTILGLLLLTDIIVSTMVLTQIRKTANLTEADSTEKLTLAIRNRLAEHGTLMRRTLRAFPYAQLYSNRLLQDFKENKAQLQAKAKQKQIEMRQEINTREQRIREKLRTLKNVRR